MNKPRKICVVTSARSEYGLLKWIIDGISKDKFLKLQLIVTGGHLSVEQGLTWQDIEKDGYSIETKVDMLIDSTSKSSIVKSMGILEIALSDIFDRLKPDLLLVLGDRYELLPICSAAIVLNIPIAHVSGGDITEGAIDNYVRNAITMMSTLHFPGTEESGNRVRQMIGSDVNVYVCGETNIDNFEKISIISKDELSSLLNLNADKEWILCTYHPETNILLDENIQRVYNLISIFKNELSDYEIIITKSNTDYGGNQLNVLWEEAAKKYKNIHIFSSLGQQRYLSILRFIKFMVGNSSSGIYESPYLKLPVINIGNRQKGRYISENILNISGSLESLRNALLIIDSQQYIDKLQSVRNPYGDGKASERIVNNIKSFFHQ